MSWLLGVALAAMESNALSADAVLARELIVEPPTLHALGFEWPISGDDNRNAVVEVSYREVGRTEWRAALPLLRIGAEKCGGTAIATEYVTPPMFAGSIFDLEPGNEYEVKFSLRDPDGGNAEKILKARTKTEPKMFENGKRIEVRPNVVELQAAFDRAEPGDQILIHAGSYTGSYAFAKSGTAEKPIVVRAAGDGEAILVGNHDRQMFDVHKADHIWLEGLTFRDPGAGDGGHTVDGVVLLAGNASHAISPGCKHLVVRRCKFEDFGVGIMAADARCEGFVITDNEFLGRQDWRGPKESVTKDYTKHSWVAVWIAGAGHDVGYNLVRGFRDGLDVVAVWKEKEYDPSRKNVSIDFYNNVITEVADDFCETDYGSHNIRFLRNLCLNTQTCGLSAQPLFGGPAYFIRNVLYNGARGVALKLNQHPSGLLVYHNTFAISWVNNSPWSNGHFRNNLFLGDGFDAITLTPYSTLDYDGFAAKQLKWNGKNYTSFEEFVKATGLETHGTRVGGLDILQRVEPPLGKERTYKPGEMDFRLKANSVAVDAGCQLHNVNDGSRGKAPDLGAYEVGEAIPTYGPRRK